MALLRLSDRAPRLCVGPPELRCRWRGLTADRVWKSWRELQRKQVVEEKYSIAAGAGTVRLHPSPLHLYHKMVCIFYESRQGICGRLYYTQINILTGSSPKESLMSSVINGNVSTLFYEVRQGQNRLGFKVFFPSLLYKQQNSKGTSAFFRSLSDKAFLSCKVRSQI